MNKKFGIKLSNFEIHKLYFETTGGKGVYYCARYKFKDDERSPHKLSYTSPSLKVALAGSLAKYLREFALGCCSADNEEYAEQFNDTFIDDYADLKKYE